MGQSQTKMQMPLVSTDASNTSIIHEPNAYEMIYQCKLSSQKKPTIEYESIQSKIAHGTKFVYFKTGKAIVLSEYNHLLCNVLNMQKPSSSFELSRLRFHTEVMYIGEPYFQFVCVHPTDNTNRLLVRTKKKTSDDTSQAINCIDIPRVWEFIWEINMQHNT